MLQGYCILDHRKVCVHDAHGDFWVSDVALGSDRLVEGIQDLDISVMTKERFAFETTDDGMRTRGS